MAGNSSIAAQSDDETRFGGLLEKATLLAAVPLLARLGTFLITVVVAQRYGESQLGAFRFAHVLAWTFLELARLGLSSLLLREIAARPSRTRAIFYSALTARLFAAGVSWLILIILMSIVDYDPTTRQLVTFLAPSILFRMISETNDDAFIATGRTSLPFVTEAVGTASFMGFSFMALAVGLGIPGLGMARLAGTALQAMIGFTLIGRTLWPPRFAGGSGGLTRLLREAWPFMIIGLTAYAISEADMILLRHLTSLGTTGLYSAAQAILSMAKLMLVAVGVATAPVLAGLFAAGRVTELKAYSRISLRLSNWFSFLCISLVTVIARPALGAVFGETFASAAGPLRVLVWVMPFYGYCNIVGYSIMAAGGEKALMAINVLVTLLSVGLNLALIPINPLMAVSTVTVASYAGCALLYRRLAARLGVQPEPLTRLNVKPALAAAVTAATLGFGMFARGDVPGLLARLRIPASAAELVWLTLVALAGTAIYLILLLLLGELDRDVFSHLLHSKILTPGRGIDERTGP
jgi:O-antigen/teichoic acid export membrane protein